METAQPLNNVHNLFYKKVEPRNVTIKLMDGAMVKGKINLLAESPQDFGMIDKHDNEMGTFYQRVSDLFTVGRNPFIVVFDATAEWQDTDVFIINKSNISWVAPED
ncbi:MAG: hypothetical protein ACLP2P_14775 [Desulfobaccales bacterium]